MLFCNNSGQTWFSDTFTSAGPLGRCWLPHLSGSGFNTSLCAQQMLMHRQSCFIPYYGMQNVALFDFFFIFLFDLLHSYRIFLYLYSISVHFYCIYFVFVLYSIICILYLFISIVYVSFLFYIRSFLCNNNWFVYNSISLLFSNFNLYSKFFICNLYYYICIV